MHGVTMKIWGIFKVKNTFLSYVNYVKDYSICDVYSHFFSYCMVLLVEVK